MVKHLINLEYSTLISLSSVIKPDVMDWLLETKNPSIGYWTLQRLRAREWTSIGDGCVYDASPLRVVHLRV